MKIWRCTAHVHTWEGDTGQVSVPLIPLRPTAGAEHISWDGFPPCSLFHLPTALVHAHGEPMGIGALGKPSFACPHPHSASVPASTAQPQTGSEPAQGS